MRKFWNKIRKAFTIHIVRQCSFSADTMEELEKIWQTELMGNGWDVHKPLDVRWNWYKFDYEYYFVAKYVADNGLYKISTGIESENHPYYSKLIKR